MKVYGMFGWVDTKEELMEILSNLEKVCGSISTPTRGSHNYKNDYCRCCNCDYDDYEDEEDYDYDDYNNYDDDHYKPYCIPF
jgi:hypothetical protein